jgi:hypothetical protein
MTTQEPLIWTKNGNVPISTLTYQTAWDDQPGYTKFVERYLDASGDVVKESAHVYSRQGLTGSGEAAQL